MPTALVYANRQAPRLSLHVDYSDTGIFISCGCVATSMVSRNPERAERRVLRNCVSLAARTKLVMARWRDTDAPFLLNEAARAAGAKLPPGVKAWSYHSNRSTCSKTPLGGWGVKAREWMMQTRRRDGSLGSSLAPSARPRGHAKGC